MLATLPQDIPLREHSHLDLQHTNTLSLDDRVCPGCKKSAVNEQGGLVVAFGQSFFHVDCFKCAKCRNQVTADTNLLLLSDGSPICANCSYSCNICHLPILDEAIMTGDDSYHAHCFKCKVCSNRIDELVFAKTSQGIYCMNCHNERMIKIRKHAQKKAEREKAQGGSTSLKSREHGGKNQMHHNESSTGEGQSRPGSANLQMSPSPSIRTPLGALRAPQKTAREPYTNDASEALPPSYSQTAGGRPPDTTRLSPSTSSFLSQSLSVAAVPPPEHHIQGNSFKPALEIYTDPLGHQPSRYSQQSGPFASPGLDSDKRTTYNDGISPLHVFRDQQPISPNVENLPLEALQSNLPTEGLFATPGLDKRRSINLSPPLSPPTVLPTSTSSNSPWPSCLESQSFNYSAIPPHLTAPDNSFKEKPSFRPPSRNDSIYSNPSATGPMQNGRHSRSSSIQVNVDDTIVISSPSSVTPDLDSFSKTLTSIKSLPIQGEPQGKPSSATLSPSDVNVQKRISSPSDISLEGRSANDSRSASPAHRADVPHSIESGTDTEYENENENENELKRPHITRRILPPAPPPKDSKGTRPITYETEADINASEMSQVGDVSEDLLESLRVERMSHSTFIAPALPPIRFSLNTTDFSELLGSVGGMTSLKSLDDAAMLFRQKQNDNAFTTPPSFVATPTSEEDATLSFSESSNSQAPMLEDTSPAVYSSSDIYDDESSYPSDPRIYPDQTQITITEPESTFAVSLGRNTSDLIYKTLQETSNSAKKTGARHLHVDISLVDAIIKLIESQKAECHDLTGKMEGMNRESRQYVDGMTVAQTKYDRELKARRDAEAEVTRLRVLLSGQAARLTVLSEDHRRQELRQQLSKELNDNLSGLEHDLSRLKVERDVTLAEVEELSANKSSTANPPDIAANNLGRSLTKRLDTIRSQYQRELIPLTEQKEALSREIAELKAVRDTFLEETTVLNARNEELAQLSTVYTRRLENATELPARILQDSVRHSSDNARPHNLIAPSLSSSTSGSSVYDENSDSRFIKTSKSDELHTPVKAKFKWPGTKAKDLLSPTFSAELNKGKAQFEHSFQQLSVLRFTRCDHCSDKMWGSQLRCTVCSISVHVRCIANVQIPCTQHQNALGDESMSLPPSMFGRDLTEQVRADSKYEERQVPVIVEKCIEAVEARALEYEGIYRKTGGSSQSKAITQMFERGDYASFDLCDADKFNDICSITSVLKTYFRSLPVPLLTFDLHDQFMAAVAIRDPSFKNKSLTDLVNRLPDEHYFTMRMLMLHLKHIADRCEQNLMNSRNLGVVFGPTLMRSRDPGTEFSDMAGKALSVEWLVDNAPQVFNIKI